MKIPSFFLALALLFGGVVSPAAAQTTINAAQAEAWGANVGWVNAAADGTNGLVVGEYVCSGYLYGANVGWINVGSGAPANHVYYQNNSATDFGLNFQPIGSGYATLRGYAYGANIGWVSFEGLGNPTVYLPTGRFSGFAYSANCGWINLGDTTYYLKTDRIVPGVDSDGDGIADAYEYQYFNGLGTANATSSYLHDGTTDLQRYLAGVSPLNANAYPRITQFSRAAGSGSAATVTFTSSAARLYRIEVSNVLVNPNWTDAGLGTFAPDGATTTRQVAGSSAGAQFFRVKVVQPGQ